VLADAVRELGAEPVSYGIVGDDIDRLRDVVRRALEATDVVVMSGGTSKGAGDVSYQVAGELTDPGIVVHGVALKPGKPICLAVTRRKPVVILPGFPTSAVFTFHEFVAPLIQQLGGMSPSPAETCRARVAVKINSEIGRTEYMLVGLVHRTASENADVAYAAYPLGKGSGSVTTFSHADGFIKIDRHCELVEANSTVTVQLLSRDLRAADLIVIGSNCIGLDVLLGHLWRQSISSKILAVGSLGGLEAAKRGECDVAGVHLLDAASGEYNTPFLTDELALLRGYGRRQGIVYRPGDPTFDTREPQQAVARALANSNCVMVNRNAGSGTRILIDQCLAGQRPPGYAVQPRSHHAVAAAVSQHRADWGVAIEQVARAAGLGFLPLTVERFDFVIPRSRWSRKATVLFRRALEDAQVRRELEQLGFELTKETA
jgi:putative molybdopterin biosynthesis protein